MSAEENEDERTRILNVRMEINQLVSVNRRMRCNRGRKFISLDSAGRASFRDLPSLLIAEDATIVCEDTISKGSYILKLSYSHCNMLNNCVGRRNFRFFVLFLLCSMTWCVLHVIQTTFLFVTIGSASLLTEPLFLLYIFSQIGLVIVMQTVKKP
jgi:hypothetical protein